MTASDLPQPDPAPSSAAALHQLKQLLKSDPAFAMALRATTSTTEAARLVAVHGVHVTPEALWRHRGTLESGGMPTWRG